MNTREIASEYRMMEWSQALQERQANGETIGEFCKVRGVSRNTYFYWQRKLRETAAKQMAQYTAGESQGLVPNGWTVCEEAASEPNDSSVTIEIGKCRVIAGADAGTDHLAKVCKVLIALMVLMSLC